MAFPEKFIDFHIHLFPDKLHAAIVKWFETRVAWDWHFKKGWKETAAYLEEMPGLTRYVPFGYAHKPGIARELNRFYAQIPLHSPKAVPLMCAHQDDVDLAGLALEGFEMGLKGVKIHCQVQNISPSDPRFIPLFEIVEEKGGIAMLHAGNGPMWGEYTGIKHTLPLLDRFPRMKTIVAHLGAFESAEFLEEALKRKNLYLDTSYTFINNPSNRLDAPVDLVAQASGKILYASDFPGICHPYEEGMDAILNLGLPEEKLAAILYGNAEKLLKEMGMEV